MHALFPPSPPLASLICCQHLRFSPFPWCLCCPLVPLLGAAVCWASFMGFLALARVACPMRSFPRSFGSACLHCAAAHVVPRPLVPLLAPALASFPLSLHSMTLATSTHLVGILHPVSAAAAATLRTPVGIGPAWWSPSALYCGFAAGCLDALILQPSSSVSAPVCTLG